MTLLQPPRLATWLLKRLADGPQCEALTGDLIERYQVRRSAVWYWWQVLSAIFACAINDAREHSGLVLRAIVVWYVLAWLAGQVAVEPITLADLIDCAGSEPQYLALHS